MRVFVFCLKCFTKARVKAAFEFLTVIEDMETRFKGEVLHLLQIKTSEVRVDVCVTNVALI